MSGWISLHRKIMDNPIYSNAGMLKLWIHCLLKASHAEHEQLIGTQIIKLDPGQFITGRDALAEEFNKGAKKSEVVTARTLWRWLKKFEEWQMLSIKSTTQFSVVTILKWSDYQKGVQRVSNACPTDVQRVSTNNNDNNVNKNIYVEIIEFLNEKAGTNFKHSTNKTRDLIKARLNEGFTINDFKTVIEYCCKEWKGKVFSNGKVGDSYLRPTTLFNNKFDERLNLAKQNKQATPQPNPTYKPFKDDWE
jgi:uncharacterized phage protein (TIGR02220 family)